MEFDKADKVRMFKNDGYTADALMKDVRYKISAALHDAGVQNTTYANQVLKGINPVQPKVQ
jgi:hypothetical protein